KGIAPKIFEGSDGVGGRIKTDKEDGFLFDQGFQVLLTAYPEAQKYLDFDALDLHFFEPGAIIYGPNGMYKVEDPLRKPTRAINALLSPVGTLADKWKMWRLTNLVKSKSIDEIFKSPSISTAEYLNRWGFSEKMITNFLQPFFSGIFLENKLSTSSRIFEFVFKMFTHGNAAIPAKGMQAIPEQLRGKLKKTTIEFGKKVSSISKKKLLFADGSSSNFDTLIIATHPSQITPDYKSVNEFQKTVNLYFDIPVAKGEAFIGLFPASGNLINNCCIVSNVASGYAPDGHSLISASLVGIPEMEEKDMIQQAKEELSVTFSLPADDIKLLRSYVIPHALPLVVEPSIELDAQQIQLSDGVFLAGDYLMNGSLNAAMASGRICANTVLKYLENH
ncbi:MAG: FAD-dependent oxidoreductase, partial [Saprospiraceae bacterium]|nr:FAD-dependent oxidoreductase [Saprospiraceae bacterium]